LLDRLADGARDRNHFQSFVRSATALGRLSALAIALVTPGILLAHLFFQPEFVQHFLQSRAGWTIVAIALGLELLGALWLYRLLKIEL
jgi:tight adherence protein B